MRLEEHVHMIEIERFGRLDRGSDLGGMMRIIVHDGDAIRLTHAIETTAHACEILQCLDRRSNVESTRPHEREHTCSIERIVTPWVLFDLAAIRTAIRQGDIE